MGRLREYRFEAGTLEYPRTYPLELPNEAERPGKYPSIKIDTPLGEFAIVAMTRHTDDDSKVSGNRTAHLYRDVLKYLHQARQPGNEANRENPIEKGVPGGYGLIALGGCLRVRLSDPLTIDSYASHDLMSSPGEVSGVLLRKDLTLLSELARDPSDVRDDPDAHDPFFAVHCSNPSETNGQWGVRIHPLDGQEVTWQAGQIIVPSLLKAKYA